MWRRSGLLGIMVSLALLVSLAVPTFAAMPMSFYGTVTIGGLPAPVDTEIIAVVEGGGGSYTTTVAGQYGNPPFDYLVVSGNIEGGAPIEFWVDGAEADQTANFYQDLFIELDLTVPGVTYELTVNADPEEGGTVTGDGNYPYCTDADITASPADECWYFVEWTGEDIADPDSASTTVHIDEEKTVTAHFAKYEYDLTVTADPEEGGIVTGTDTYDCCTDAAITATEADPCWYFVEWTGEDIANTGSPETTVHIDEEKTVTAHFAKYQYALTVTADPEEGGTVTGTDTYDCCTDAAITAYEADGWYFVNWTGEGIAEPGSASTTVHIDDDKTVTANFTMYQYDLTVIADPVEGGTVTGTDTYPYCTDAAITASPADECWYFVEWTGEGIAEPGSASTTVHIDAEKTVTAHFAKYEYALTVTADPEEGGTVTGTGTYPCCTDADITASAEDGWYFVEWTGEGIANTGLPSTTVHIDGEKTVTAHFAEIIGFFSTLYADWNLLSTPVLLDEDSDSLGQIFDVESQGNIDICLSWDPVSGDWVQVFEDYELVPLYAIYVKVKPDALAVAEFVPSEELSWPPSRDLEPGLNLIGPAPQLEAGVFPAIPLDLALVSIEETAGGLKGYIIVVSPEHNQPGWTYALDGEIKDLLPYKGYWVVMENADTLFGFSTTPIQ